MRMILYDLNESDMELMFEGLLLLYGVMFFCFLIFLRCWKGDFCFYFIFDLFVYVYFGYFYFWYL